MKPKICFFILSILFLSYHTTLSQNKVQTLNFKGNFWESFAVTGSHNSVCVYQGSYSKQFILFADDSGKRIENTFPGYAGHEIAIGNLQTDTSYDFFFLNLIGGAYKHYYININKVTGLATKTNPEKVELEKNEYLITTAFDGRFFYLISGSKDCSCLAIQKCAFNMTYEKKYYFSKDMLNHNLFTNRTFTNSLLSPDNSLYKNTSPNKLYFDNDTLFVTMDGSDQNQSTAIYQIPLSSDSIYIKSINEPLYEGALVNSVVFERKLFRLTIAMQDVRLSIFDLNTDSILKKYECTVADSPYFMQSPLTIWKIKNKKSWIQEQTKIERLAHILKYVIHGLPSLSIETVNSDIQISIGSYSTVMLEDNDRAAAWIVAGVFAGMASGGRIFLYSAPGSLPTVSSAKIHSENKYASIEPFCNEGETYFFKMKISRKNLELLKDTLILSRPEQTWEFEEKYFKSLNTSVTKRWIFGDAQSAKAAYLDRNNILYITPLD